MVIKKNMPMVQKFNDSKESIMNSSKLYTFSHNGVIKGCIPCIFSAFFKLTSLSVLPLAKFFKNY